MLPDLIHRPEGRRLARRPVPRCLAPRRSYGKAAAPIQALARAVAVLISLLVPGGLAAAAADAPVRIVALGDSLTAGFGLSPEEAFPARLAAALKAKGLDVDIANAGVSGDTASGGLARLDWSVPEDTEAVILELGANDAMRGTDPEVTRNALDEILRRLEARHIQVLLAGMMAPPNLGGEYVAAFDSIFPKLAEGHDVVFYPFFLEGVVSDRALNQPDGLHPTARGIDIIVSRILPKVEELVARVKQARRER
jgi:acyl-CoA thioesterase I